MPLNGLTGVTDIVGGGSHMCAIESGGSVVCWGDDEQGQLGDGWMDAGSASAVPLTCP